MTESVCGVNCNECPLNRTCGGCAETGGKPFGGDCVVAKCCFSKRLDRCGSCTDARCGIKSRLLSDINALGIEDMETVTELHALRGAFVNLEYTLPDGRAVKLLDDNKIYFGNQISKKDSARCYGVAADESFLLISEYGENGADAQVVLYKKR